MERHAQWARSVASRTIENDPLYYARPSKSRRSRLEIGKRPLIRAIRQFWPHNIATGTCRNGSGIGNGAISAAALRQRGMSHARRTIRGSLPPTLADDAASAPYRSANAVPETSPTSRPTSRRPPARHCMGGPNTGAEQRENCGSFTMCKIMSAEVWSSAEHDGTITKYSPSITGQVRSTSSRSVNLPMRVSDYFCSLEHEAHHALPCGCGSTRLRGPEALPIGRPNPHMGPATRGYATRTWTPTHRVHPASTAKHRMPTERSIVVPERNRVAEPIAGTSSRNSTPASTRTDLNLEARVRRSAISQ